jgi:hypothetical protein
MRFQGEVRRAPGPKLEVYQLVELADFDPERVAYLLMTDIYNAFGYEALSVPYISISDPKPKLKAEAITGGDLPETVRPPDYY